jgi:hypothetical protein
VDEPRLLAIYLNDHLAGATLGVALARRACRSNAGTDLGVFLERLAVEIEEDRRHLLRVIALFGVKPSTGKRLAAVAAERLGRLKLNGRFRSYSPLSRVLELEGLSMGIEGKRSLWTNLRESPGVAARLEDVDLAALVERAERQHAELQPHRIEAARAAFGASAGAPTPSG